MMLAIMLLAQDLQSILDQGKPGDWSARVTAESGGRRDEPAARSKGTVEVRSGELRAELAGVIVTMREGDDFHPFEVWRAGLGPWLRERFEVKLERAAGGDPLPAAVKDASGKESAPVALKARPKSRIVAAEAEVEHHVLRLVPREAYLRERYRLLRLHVSPSTFRVDRLEVETATLITAYALE